MQVSTVYIYCTKSFAFYITKHRKFVSACSGRNPRLSWQSRVGGICFVRERCTQNSHQQNQTLLGSAARLPCSVGPIGFNRIVCADITPPTVVLESLAGQNITADNFGICERELLGGCERDGQQGGRRQGSYICVMCIYSVYTHTNMIDIIRRCFDQV